MYSYEEDRKEYIYGYIISELCYMDTRQFDYIKRNVRKSKIREKLFDLINSDMDSKQRALYFENFSLNLQELSSLRKKKIIKKMEYFLCLDGKFDEQDRNILSRVALQDYQFDSNRIHKRLNKLRKIQNKNVIINIKDDLVTKFVACEVDKKHSNIENVVKVKEDTFLCKKTSSFNFYDICHMFSNVGSSHKTIIISPGYNYDFSSPYFEVRCSL